MRRLAVHAVGFGILSSIFYAGPAAAAGSCPDGQVPVAGPGQICIPAADLGSSGEGGGGSGTVTPGSGTGGGDTGPSACSRYEPVSPAPQAGAPEWGDHTPDEGRLVLCVPPGAGNPTYVFMPNGDELPPDPADLARKALDELKLATPDVHLAPAPPDQTYVGLDTWLWMPPGQWATLKKSVTAGDTSVTVAAAPKSVLWDMGPSSTTCYSAGREWKPKQMPPGSKTDCSYKYTKVSDFEPGQKFQVSATITYQANWTCNGECVADEGDLGDVPSAPGGAAISVGEHQSIVISGGKK